MKTRRWIAVGCASIGLAAPAPAFAASASAAGAQQQLPQEQQQTRAAQSIIEQMQQQLRALHRQFVENQEAFDRIQQEAPPHSPYEALPLRSHPDAGANTRGRLKSRRREPARAGRAIPATSSSRAGHGRPGG